MSGGEYAPKDSRDVTLHPTEPGVSSGWREREPAAEAVEDKLAPGDQRNVTGSVPAGSAPGADTGWREAERRDPPNAHRDDIPPAKAEVGSTIPGAPRAEPPAGVPQDDRPFTAEEAEAAGRLDG